MGVAILKKMFVPPPDVLIETQKKKYWKLWFYGIIKYPKYLIFTEDERA